jgi:hypothetical protein
MLHYPNVAPEPGDRIEAKRDGSWGHLADGWDPIEPNDAITIEFGERCDMPYGDDTWHATINGTEHPMHMDVVTDIFQLADSLTYER